MVIYKRKKQIDTLGNLDCEKGQETSRLADNMNGAKTKEDSSHTAEILFYVEPKNA